MKNFYRKFERTDELFEFYWNLGALRLHYNVKQGTAVAEFATHTENAQVTDPQLVSRLTNLDMLDCVRERYSVAHFELPVFSELLARCGVARLTYTFALEMMSMYNTEDKLVLAHTRFEKDSLA
ncbi:hypothetical protein [Secundilactobacillus kimchicus]|nr:hypothetical protein [Secundilactobacillus kimchicus]MBT9672486.1 hypothetical protein [Secundilactobacillus kimchicus]